MSIIASMIHKRLSSHESYHCIVTGLDRSGKTTMIKNLINEYKYIKFSYVPDDGNKIPWDHICTYQIFDRSPLIDYYVYTDLYVPSDNEDARWRIESVYLDTHLKYFCKPMFVFYLHNLWDDGSQLQSIYDNLDKIQNRYIRVIQYLKNKGYYIIVCTDKGIRQYNALWESTNTRLVKYTDENGEFYKW